MTNEPALSTILRRGRWLIAARLAAGLLLGLLALRLADDVYEAQALLRVHAAPAAEGLAVERPEALTETYAALIVDRSFLEGLAPRLRGVEGERRDVASLRDALDAEVVRDTALIRLRAEGPTARDARDLANDVANGFVISVRQETLQRSAQLQDALRAEIAQITRRIRRPRGEREELAVLLQQRAALVRRQQELVAAAAQQSLGVSVAAPAAAPESPVRPKPALHVAAGLLLGLLTGLGLAWLRARLAGAEEPAPEAERVAAPEVARS